MHVLLVILSVKYVWTFDMRSIPCHGQNVNNQITTELNRIFSTDNYDIRLGKKILWKLILRTVEFVSFKDFDPTLAKVSPIEPSVLTLEERQTRHSKNRFWCPRDFRHFWGQYGLSDDCLLSSNVERCVARQFSI